MICVAWTWTPITYFTQFGYTEMYRIDEDHKCVEDHKYVYMNMLYIQIYITKKKLTQHSTVLSGWISLLVNYETIDKGKFCGHTIENGKWKIET